MTHIVNEDRSKTHTTSYYGASIMSYTEKSEHIW